VDAGADDAEGGLATGEDDLASASVGKARTRRMRKGGVVGDEAGPSVRGRAGLPSGRGALDPARGLETMRPVQRVSRPATGSGSTSLARRLARRRHFPLSSFNQRWRGVSCKNDTKNTSLTDALCMPLASKLSLRDNAVL